MKVKTTVSQVAGRVLVLLRLIKRQRLAFLASLFVMFQAQLAFACYDSYYQYGHPSEFGMWREGELSKLSLLSGQVRTVVTEAIEFAEDSGEWVEKQRRLSWKVAYDEQGRLIDETWDLGGGFYYSTAYAFDDQGNLLEQIDKDEDGSVHSRWVYRYDEQGNRIESLSIRADNVVERKTTSRYDDRGNSIETAFYDGDGSLQSRFVSRYDEQGNLIETASYHADGSLSLKTVNSYDDKGNLLEEARYSEDGSLSCKNVYRYDAKGNKVEESGYAEGSLHTRITYSYDEQGNLLGSSRYGYQDALESTSTYRYDDQGNLIEESEQNADGVVYFRRVYAYDANGNQLEVERSNYSSSDGSLLDGYSASYDERGNKLEQSWTRAGERITRSVYSYDKEGKLTGTLMYRDDTLISKNVRVYDDRGSWVKTTSFKWVEEAGEGHFEPISSTEREITYHAHHAVASPSPGTDTVELRGDIRLMGTLEPSAVIFITQGGDVEVLIDDIVDFHDGLLTLADGTSLTGAFQDGTIGLTTLRGAFNLSATEITSIQREPAATIAVPVTVPSMPLEADAQEELEAEPNDHLRVPSAFGRQFAADMIVDLPDGAVGAAKVFVGEQKLRIEISDGNMEVVYLYDFSGEEVILQLLLPRERRYTEVVDHTPFLWFATPDHPRHPCQAEPESWRCQHLGTDELDGRLAERWQIERQIEVESLILIVWIDAHEGVTLQGEGGGSVFEFRNHQFGPQPDHLFEVPEGYQWFDPEGF